MAKVTSKSAGKFKVGGGKKGGMANFKGVGTQKPGVTEVDASGGGTNPGAPIPAGGKGKIGGKQVGVKAIVPGKTSVR